MAIIALTLTRAGFFTWVGIIAQTHRRVLMLGAVAVAFLFPFTQDGSVANMSIATQVLIFASTALGLNIVVGLAGLLDLGYIAFLGAGAYVQAIFSHSAFSTVGWKPPFVVVIIMGTLVSATLGLIIGSPTLQVSGTTSPSSRWPSERSSDSRWATSTDRTGAAHERTERHSRHPGPRDRVVQLRRDP